MFAEDISEDFSDITFTLDFIEYFWIYLRNLRGRLLSSEKFFTLWVFALKPFPGKGNT